MVLKTGNLNSTIAKVWYTELAGMDFGDSLSKIVFPSFESMGLTVKDPTKDFTNLMVIISVCLSVFCLSVLSVHESSLSACLSGFCLSVLAVENLVFLLVCFCLSVL